MGDVVYRGQSKSGIWFVEQVEETHDRNAHLKGRVFTFRRSKKRPCFKVQVRVKSIKPQLVTTTRFCIHPFACVAFGSKRIWNSFGDLDDAITFGERIVAEFESSELDSNNQTKSNDATRRA